MYTSTKDKTFFIHINNKTNVMEMCKKNPSEGLEALSIILKAYMKRGNKRQMIHKQT